MVVGAWCWQDGGECLRLAGCLDAHGAALLVHEATRRRPPREVILPGLALTEAGAAEVAHALPDVVSLSRRRRAAHDIRNALTVLRLRLQMMGNNPSVPQESLRSALDGLDDVAEVVDRLDAPP